MRTFKQIDFSLQFIAIIAGTLYSLFSRDFTFIYPYFIVGGLQVISFLIHLAAGSQIGLTRGRRLYGWFLLVTAVFVLLGWPLAIPALLFLVLLILLFASPIIAFLYCRMCYQELQLIHHETK